MTGDRALAKRASYIHDRLQVLDRLSSESVQLLDALGTSLYDLSNLTAPIHSRATALTAAQRNIAAAKQAVDQLLDHLDTSRRVGGVLEAGPAADLDGFLTALQQLEASNDYLQQHARLAAVKAGLAHTQGLFNRALEQCDADFASSLAAGGRVAAPSGAWLRSNKDTPITDANRAELVQELVPAALLPKLRRMVELMLEAAYTPAQTSFIAARDAVMRRVLQEAGLELRPAGALAALPPEQLDGAISAWSSQLRVITLLLISEQQLADSLWPAPLNTELFAQLAGPYLSNLVAAGHDITEAKKTPDKIFALLDMHHQLSASLPVLQGMLAGSQALDRLLADLERLLRICATAALALFGDYEDSVARDASKTLPLDGTIHPLTAQVLSFLKRLLNYEDAASVIYGAGAAEHDPGGAAEERGETGSSSPAQDALATGIARLLMQLLDNLEVKSRAYKNEALAALFMMNNVHYVQWSVENSPVALQLLGMPWLERHKDAVEDWGAKYNEVTWMPLVNMFKAEPPGDVSRLKLMLKETFTAFNAALERIYTNQSGWTIPDHMLRGAVKRVIKDDLLGPYQEFMRTHADVQFTSNPARYIKYAASDVASIIDDDLFETKAVSMNKLSLKKEKLDAI